jgi:hypothetical protein
VAQPCSTDWPADVSYGSPTASSNTHSAGRIAEGRRVRAAAPDVGYGSLCFARRSSCFFALFLCHNRASNYKGQVATYPLYLSLSLSCAQCVRAETLVTCVDVVSRMIAHLRFWIVALLRPTDSHAGHIDTRIGCSARFTNCVSSTAHCAVRKSLQRGIMCEQLQRRHCTNLSFFLAQRSLCLLFAPQLCFT